MDDGVNGGDGDGARRPYAPHKLRTLARWRRPVGVVLLLVPGASAVLTDAARRWERMLGFDAFHTATYAAAVLESIVVWGLLLYAAARRRGRGSSAAGALFVVALTFAFGGQEYFFEQYNAYLNVDVSLFASNFMDSVVNQLFADLGNYLASKALPCVFAISLVFLARRLLRPRRNAARVTALLGPAALVGALFVPLQHRHVQAATPDMLYLNAVGGLLRTQLGLTEQSHQLRPRVREPLAVPPLTAVPAATRNVLFIILESVRADSVCVAFDPACRLTASTSALVPERVPLLQMRSLASSTAISLAVLWTGVGPHASRDVLHSWPSLFEYAAAAGWDSAFFTSQNMMFGNARLWVKNLPVSKFVSATDLDPTSDLDMGAPERLLAERVNRELPGLREPFLAVIQFSNVHYPYYVEDTGPFPFRPFSTSKAPEDELEFKNYYQNSVYQQDEHVASILRALRGSPAGQRTVVVYTSDHGEAFREHNQMGHTFSVFDEEIKVPAWIDAPPGTLTGAERENLSAKRETFTFHSDFAPTILDLMGLWDAAELSGFKQNMLGQSLLRSGYVERPQPLTNCSGVWSCAFENWGYMRGSMKLEARGWDVGWHCFDLREDPYEENDLGVAACNGLEQLALSTFGRLPGQKAE